jgi:hypothetical protein
MLRTLLAVLVVVCILSLPAHPALAEEEEVKKPPSPAVPVEKGGSLIGAGRLVVEPAITYSTYSREKVSISGFTIFEAILIGRINVGRIQRHIIAPSLTLRYGLTDLELSTRIPYLIRTDDESFPAGETISHFDATDAELGDIEVAAFYHLLGEGRTRPDIIIGLTGKTDTGRDPYGLKKITVENSSPKLAEFPTGSGHWGLAGTVIFVKSSDPAVLFLNTSYFLNFGRDVGVVGGQNFGEIDPGDSIEYQFGLVLGLNERLAMNFSFSQRITWDSEQNGRKLRDSGANAALANFGMTYAFSRQLSVDVVTGIGMTDDAPDFTIGVRLPITLFL